jgi:hypothetical protein
MERTYGFTLLLLGETGMPFELNFDLFYHRRGIRRRFKDGASSHEGLD